MFVEDSVKRSKQYSTYVFTISCVNCTTEFSVKETSYDGPSVGWDYAGKYDSLKLFKEKLKCKKCGHSSRIVITEDDIYERKFNKAFYLKFISACIEYAGLRLLDGLFISMLLGFLLLTFIKFFTGLIIGVIAYFIFGNLHLSIYLGFSIGLIMLEIPIEGVDSFCIEKIIRWVNRHYNSSLARLILFIAITVIGFLGGITHEFWLTIEEAIYPAIVTSILIDGVTSSNKNKTKNN